MPTGHYSKPIRLAGSSTAELNSQRIAIISSFLDNAEAKINHFDTFRQRNLLAALAGFAAMFTFSQNAHTLAAVLVTSGATLLVMLILYYVDHRLHKYSEGWQATRKCLAERLADAHNEYSEDVQLLLYCKAGEANASPWSPRFPLLYLILTLGGPLAIVASYYLLG